MFCARPLVHSDVRVAINIGSSIKNSKVIGYVPLLFFVPFLAVVAMDRVGLSTGGCDASDNLEVWGLSMPLARYPVIADGEDALPHCLLRFDLP